MVSGLTDVLFWCTSGLSLRAEVAFSTLTSGLSEGRSGTVESWWTWPTSLRGKSTLGICMRTTFTLHQNQLMPSIGIPPGWYVSLSTNWLGYSNTGGLRFFVDSLFDQMDMRNTRYKAKLP